MAMARRLTDRETFGDWRLSLPNIHSENDSCGTNQMACKCIPATVRDKKDRPASAGAAASTYKRLGQDRETGLQATGANY